MNLAAIIHRPSTEYIYPSSEYSLEIQLVTAREDVDEVELLYWMRYETDPAKMRRQRLRVSLRDALRDYYRATICTKEIAAYTRYCYHLKSADEEVWLGAKGFQHSEPTMNENFYEFLWPNKTDGYGAPSWRNRQVYYQIFPERFKNGDPAISPAGTEPWGSPPTRENFMGGDLAGIIDGLDYIEQLGVTCLYLTPIFRSPSNHKYDTIDYFSIDPAFGTNEAFRRLVQEVHSRRMRIILDGVFNHCGYYWDKFQDVVQNGEASEYSDWFFIHDHPVQVDQMNYDCVGHYRWMPKLNLSNPAARDYFISVGRYWIQEFGIDGWRLDVADEVPTSFLEAFSAAMREVKPDCILLGETWGDAERLITGNRLDSAMNYLFRDAVRDWLALECIDAETFGHRVNEMLARYPREVSLRMYNLLDSHDTERFLTLCGGDESRQRLAVALQMCFPGCPAIYYGDEIGMEGENDPDCRRAMDWNLAESVPPLLHWIKQLTALRRQLPALTGGGFHVSLCDNAANVFGFCRTHEEEAVLVVICAGKMPYTGQARVPAGGEWQEVFTGELLPTEHAPVNDSYSSLCPEVLNVRTSGQSVRIFKQIRK